MYAAFAILGIILGGAFMGCDQVDLRKAGQMAGDAKQAIEKHQNAEPKCPESTDVVQIQCLGILDGEDAASGYRYTYIVYKEQERGAQDYRIKACKEKSCGFITGTQAAGKAAQALQGGVHEGFFTFGEAEGMVPSSEDSRHIEFRVHHLQGEPTEVEVFMILRDKNGKAKEPQTLTAPWPV